MQSLIDLSVILVFIAVAILCVYLGFRMGRTSIDKPLSPLRDQTTGQPVLSEYSPYDDAMGIDEVKETV